MDNPAVQAKYLQHPTLEWLLSKSCLYRRARRHKSKLRESRVLAGRQLCGL